MYCLEFICIPGNYECELKAQDKLIQEGAESMPGDMGKESWQSADAKKINSAYYWKDEKSIKAFSSPPRYIEEKKQYA